jgi:serine protein kinase
LVEGLKSYVQKYKTKPDVLTFEQYLAKVRGNPKIAALAHKRIYDMITSYGHEVNEELGEERYKFFETQLFGIETSTKEIMEYFKGAALGSDVGKRFLLLYGPPSSGKSNLVSMLKDALEAWSKTDDGAVYGIKGCPMHEEPLHAIPHAMRSQVEKDLGVKIEGELCPVCSHKLRHDMGGDFTAFETERVFFTQQGRTGIGTFVPSDPKSQDISELIGSVDLSKVGEYGSESDPRAYRFDGELNISNRGMLEFIEILKADIKFLYVLLTATQEKNIKTPRFPLIYCDEAIISHTNESEYKEFVGNPKNEALIDRMIVCRIPYNLKVNEEVKIYDKLLRQGDTADVHVAPHTLRVAALFSILSRLTEPKDQGMDLVKKMRLYNGEDVEGFSLRDVPRLRRENLNEGMDGISPRYIINRLVTTAIRGDEKGSTIKYITPIDVLRALKDGLVTSSKFKQDERQKYEDLLGIAKQEFDSIARNEVQKAFFVSFEDEARALLDNYINNVEAYLEKSKLEDPITHEEIEPDEKLMRSIESKINVSENGKDSFRNEVIRKVGMANRRGVEFRYEEHTRLRDAIEKQLFEDRRDVIKMTISTRSKDPEDLKRINQVVKTLCDKHGYIPESANELLKYVSSIMSREK